MKARSDDSFPWHNTFARFGSKQQFADKTLTLPMRAASIFFLDC